MAVAVATPAGKLGAVCVAESDEVRVLVQLRASAPQFTLEPVPGVVHLTAKYPAPCDFSVRSGILALAQP